jgi:hypothetical protein
MPPPGIHLPFQQSMLFHSHLKGPAATLLFSLLVLAPLLFGPNLT